MKKKLLAVLLVGILSASVLTACGGEKKEEAPAAEAPAAETISDEDAAEVAAEVVEEQVEEQVNAGAEDLEIPESTGDMSVIVGSWGIAKMMDAEGNEFTLEDYAAANGVDADTLRCTYTFNEDGTGAITLAGIDTKYVWSVDEAGEVTMQTAQTPIKMTYADEDDLLIIQDPNTGITTGFGRE